MFSDLFFKYANSLDSGYLKKHKAIYIISTIQGFDVLREDKSRLKSYFYNSLDMEGFSTSDINKIIDWYYLNKDKLFDNLAGMV